MKKRSSKLSLVAPAAFLLCLAGITGCETRAVGAAPSGPLEVEVVERGSAVPCEGVVVEVHTLGRLAGGGVTSGSGRILVPHAQSGTATVCVRDPLGRFVDAVVEAEEPGSTRIEVERGTMATLRVLDGEGNPIPRASVTAWVSGPRTLQGEARDGVGRIGPIPRGAAKLVIAAVGHSATVLDVEVKDVATASPLKLGEVRLRAGGRELRGVVAGEASRLPREALLRYGGAGQVVPVNPDGSFIFAGLPEDSEFGGTGEAFLALRRGSKDVYAVDVRLVDRKTDLGTIHFD